MAYAPTPMTDNGLSTEAKEFFDAITVNRKGVRVLRASKPQKATGEQKYMWRMVAFYMSRNPVHHCMPVCASFDLEGSFDDRRATEKRLKIIEDEIVNAQPKENQFGLRRWANAFGVGR